jgi:hypothetical protein
VTLRSRLFASAEGRYKIDDSLYELVPQLEVISGFKVRCEMKRRSRTSTTYIEYANYRGRDKLVVSNLSSFGVGLKGSKPTFRPCFSRHVKTPLSPSPPPMSNSTSLRFILFVRVPSWSAVHPRDLHHVYVKDGGVAAHSLWADVSRLTHHGQRGHVNPHAVSCAQWRSVLWET